MFDQNDLELLNAYLDGELSAAERAHVDTRLQADAGLRRELERLRVTRDLIAGMPTLRAPRDFRLPRTMARRSRLITSAAFSSLSAAAAVILLVLGGTLFLRGGQLSNVNLTAATQVVSAPSALPDASPDAAERDRTTDDSFAEATPNPEVERAQPSILFPSETTPGEVMVQPSKSRGALPSPPPQATMMMPFAVQPPSEMPAENLPEGAAGRVEEDAQAANEQEIGAAKSGMADMVAQAPAPANTPAPTRAAASATPPVMVTNSPSPTVTATASLTRTATAPPTATPTPTAATAGDGVPLDRIGVGLIAAAAVLFGVAVVTTLLRRRD